jgi:hypothetical protein
MIFEKCRDILVRESELVQKAGALQELIQSAVKSRKWTDFEGHFAELGALEQEIAGQEREREALFDKWAEGAGQEKSGPTDDKSRFYAMVSRLPAEQRNELTAIYRGLKLEALKLRMANETLMSYLKGAQATVKGFFQAAFPDRGGRIYTKYGTPISHDMRSMVLNRAF